ncbi:fluoride efflux transporter CrcB [Candidatus Latescibacterota bacterium]
MQYKFIALVIAGACGTLLRYGCAAFVQRSMGSEFPWGTLMVNIFGCFLAGFLWTIIRSKWDISGEVRIAVFIGFLGAFTTFSTYMLETGTMLRSSQWMWAAGHIAGNNIGGFLSLMAGMALGAVL